MSKKIVEFDPPCDCLEWDSCQEEAYKQGYQDGLKVVEEYKYHNLETDPTDLPKYTGTFLVSTTHGISLAWFMAESKEWNYKKNIVRGWWKLPTEESVACGQI